MAAKSSNTLKDRLKETMAERKITFPKLSRIVGIPASRMYKWYEEDTNPKYADAELLEKWILGEPLELSPNNVHEERRKAKMITDPEREGIDFVDISAQAGYPKGILNPMFKSSLKKIFIPGMPYRGENYRIWEVEGNSMEPTFKEGFYVLTEKVEPPWAKIKEHHAHVIVTQDDVYLKRIVQSKTKENHWALVSDNEELYPPFLLPVEEVKELWFVRRKMDWEMSPPKRFDINI